MVSHRNAGRRNRSEQAQATGADGSCLKVGGVLRDMIARGKGELPY